MLARIWPESLIWGIFGEEKSERAEREPNLLVSFCGKGSTRQPSLRVDFGVGENRIQIRISHLAPVRHWGSCLTTLNRGVFPVGLSSCGCDEEPVPGTW